VNGGVNIFYTRHTAWEEMAREPEDRIDQPTTWITGWSTTGTDLERASVAESVGFDTFVFEDALLYCDEKPSQGCWESVSIAAALAATTSRIEIGPSVFSAPYRSAAMTAKIAETLDEISGGRFIFGIGAGNVPDSDYEAFGFPTDHRYSRFAEAIEIIHGLLKRGEVDYAGEYYSARKAELVVRGPRSRCCGLLLGMPMAGTGGPSIIEAQRRPCDPLSRSWSVHATRSEEIRRRSIGLSTSTRGRKRSGDAQSVSRLLHGGPAQQRRRIRRTGEGR